MPRSDPFKRRILFQEFLIKDDLFILSAQFAEAWLQLLAERPEIARSTTNTIDMRLPSRIGHVSTPA